MWGTPQLSRMTVVSACRPSTRTFPLTLGQGRRTVKTTEPTPISPTTSTIATSTTKTSNSLRMIFLLILCILIKDRAATKII